MSDGEALITFRKNSEKIKHIRAAQSTEMGNQSITLNASLQIVHLLM